MGLERLNVINLYLDFFSPIKSVRFKVCVSFVFASYSYYFHYLIVLYSKMANTRCEFLLRGSDEILKSVRTIRL